MLPVAKMKTNILHEELAKTMASIEQATGRLKAIISDANRTNQACFNKYDTVITVFD